MRSELVKLFVIIALMCIGCGGCSRSHNHADRAEADGLDPSRWQPTADAIAAAKREKKAPLIVARPDQPRASAYDLNPRAATGDQQAESTDLRSDSEPNEQADDPALGGIAKLPPP